MKILCSGRRMTAFFMSGFFFGVLYVNFRVSRSIAGTGVFSEYFLSRYSAEDVVKEEYFWYLLRIRGTLFLLLGGAAFTRIRRESAALFLIWTGFLCGMLLSMAVFCMGVKGILLCFIGIMPHFLLYIPGCMLIVRYCFAWPKGVWNRQKTIFVLLMAILGIAAEIYISPVLMDGFLSVL